ncbi:PTS sugar transporter subunit IIB [Tepidimicrobium xylanilyticum]|uniref:PTS system, cellobiose-specific IIB component n=1 Tax=Tepidimicrobium xylanilyticum TaxID=1123352 RepID=A0A1H2QC29_9FIRM|nr:PTS sugar transporter subunit IIB [Tepidimicrobium xylanilyticum]SDW04721.1 PTS system, cellobiose-specific IIB component [Tepidimicrobium xylanilyticum]
MKILLVCAAGMSTSLVVNKMKKALGPDEQDWIIEAKPAERFEDEFKKYDVVLLGPQIRFKKDEFEKIAREYNIPVETINTADYGLANGEKILDFAKELYENKK